MLVAFLVCTFTRFDIITSLIAYFMSFLCLSRGINYTICNDYLGFSRKIPMEFPPNFPIPCGNLLSSMYYPLEFPNSESWLKLLIREKKEEYILYIFYIFYSLCKLVFTISIVASFRIITATATTMSEWWMRLQLPLCLQIVSENFARMVLLFC